MYIVWVEVEAIHNGGTTEWGKQGTGLPGTEVEAGLHYRVHVGQCSGGNTKMGMNGTDIFYNRSKSILRGAKSECVWGVLPHRMRRIRVLGSTTSSD
jgi:CO dehydrogenase/acetyl-CoA synthase beta subunit